MGSPTRSGFNLKLKNCSDQLFSFHFGLQIKCDSFEYLCSSIKLQKTYLNLAGTHKTGCKTVLKFENFFQEWVLHSLVSEQLFFFQRTSEFSTTLNKHSTPQAIKKVKHKQSLHLIGTLLISVFLFLKLFYSWSLRLWNYSCWALD